MKTFLEWQIRDLVPLFGNLFLNIGNMYWLILNDVLVMVGICASRLIIGGI